VQISLLIHLFFACTGTLVRSAIIAFVGGKKQNSTTGPVKNNTMHVK